jgi:hypothetical protein
LYIQIVIYHLPSDGKDGFVTPNPNEQEPKI